MRSYAQQRDFDPYPDHSRGRVGSAADADWALRRQILGPGHDGLASWRPGGRDSRFLNMVRRPAGFSGCGFLRSPTGTSPRWPCWDGRAIARFGRLTTGIHQTLGITAGLFRADCWTGCDPSSLVALHIEFMRSARPPQYPRDLPAESAGRSSQDGAVALLPFVPEDLISGFSPPVNNFC
jgi:hypothetical protein